MSLSVSIVIPNYNYGRFLGAAVESALALNWPKIEVIVVDDGSTDSSVEVVRSFGDRVILIQQPNAGQAHACRTGFVRSCGDLIVFLDSDDRLLPSLICEVMPHWTPRVAKAQVQMELIARNGLPLGGRLPQFTVVPSSSDIRLGLLTRGEYPTPPGSGNVYARWFVEKVFSTPTTFVDRSSDSYLLAAAPMLGDVVTIAKALVQYRVHGDNHGAFLVLDETRFAREVNLGARRHAFGVEVGKREGMETAPDALDRNLSFLALRVASLVLRPDLHPLPCESRSRLMRFIIRAALAGRGVSRRERATLAVWAVTVCALPTAMARPLISWRYAPATRPAALKTALRLLRVVKK